MPITKIGALQMGSAIEGKAATLGQILGFEQRIKEAEASLVVLPEALLGGYPKGEIFGTRLGFRLPEGRAAFADYYANAGRRSDSATGGNCGAAAAGILRRARRPGFW